MTIRRILIAALLLVSSLVSMYAQDISGRWAAKFTTEVGEQEYSFDFVVKGTQLTGKIKGNLLGESAIAEGKIEGGKITFVENGSFMEMPLRIVYTGTVASADEIKFSRNVADIATEELVARRVK